MFHCFFRDAHDTFFLQTPSKATLSKPEYAARVKSMHEKGSKETGSIGWRYEWSYDEAQKNIMRTHTTAVSSKMLYKLGQQKVFTPKKYFSYVFLNFGLILCILVFEILNFFGLILCIGFCCFGLILCILVFEILNFLAWFCVSVFVVLAWFCVYWFLKFWIFLAWFCVSVFVVLAWFCVCFRIDRVFRNETLDATHLAEFHQVEGFVAGVFFVTCSCVSLYVYKYICSCVYVCKFMCMYTYVCSCVCRL